MTEPASTFPDTSLAYGATNEELRAYGTAPRLAGAGRLALLLACQLLVAVGCVVVVAVSSALVVRLLAGAVGLLLSASALVAWLQLLATPRRLTLTSDGMIVEGVPRWRRRVAWEDIGEIGHGEQHGRQAVGLRLRDGARPPGPRRRAAAGFDYLLWPADGDPTLLGRVLLRYCIDPRVRRRYLKGAAGAAPD